MSLCGAAAAVIGFRVGRSDQDVSVLGQEEGRDQLGFSVPPAGLSCGDRRKDLCSSMWQHEARRKEHSFSLLKNVKTVM